MTHAFSWVGARCVDPARQPHNRTHHKHIRDACHIINNNNIIIIIIIISSEEGEVDEQEEEEEEEEDESLSHLSARARVRTPGPTVAHRK